MKQVWKWFVYVVGQNDKPSLEVFTPTLKNDSILLQYFKELVFFLKFVKKWINV
jgi:hypothetical protein